MESIFDTKLKNLNYVESAEIQESPKKISGGNLGRKSVTDDKLRNVSSLADNSVTKAMCQDDIIGKNELDYEEATITISGTDTSGTATVESGAERFSWFMSAFSGTPTVGYPQIAVSGTTLTLTLTAAPGAGNSVTFRIKLIQA